MAAGKGRMSRLLKITRKNILTCALLILAICGLNALPGRKADEPELLFLFKNAYPDVEFNSKYDMEAGDWLIKVTSARLNGTHTKTTELYWSDSRFLPREELKNSENYRKMLYLYSFKIPEPSEFTEDDIIRIKQFTSTENRRNGAIEPPFLYDAIYDTGTRESTEQQIVKIDFLTKSINIHKKIEAPMKRISKKIMALSKQPELQPFFSTLSRTDGYAWRSVRDTKSKSFHSLGLAIDILPRGYYQKVIYWGWQKQLRPDDWYLTPVSKRWTPPEKLIEAFAEEGFIWGGTWIVWDNMHFEYRPELIAYKEYCENNPHR